jgi:diaminohydroxyphosphoribosylaminopyrimidine deaminase/5-amino-6-(5-phosphoribosylamino)uracil reductase
MLHSLFENNIQSVLVEGGTKTLQSFIDIGLWDEARIITNETMVVEGGIDAPQIKDFSLIHLEKYFTDSITYFKRK